MIDNKSTITLSQSDRVFLHSPLNLLAQFVLLLEERFSQKNLPWQFNRDENQTDIFIHTEYSYPQEISNPVPRIIVGRGTVVHGRSAIGDLDQNQPDLLQREGYYHWGPGECDIQIHCVSENRGETSLLGDIVQTLIGMSRNEICKQFTLRDISPVMLQPTQPFERDKEKWQAAVQFRVSFEHRWFTHPAAPTLKEISFYSQSALDALDYVKRFVLRSDVLPESHFK